MANASPTLLLVDDDEPTRRILQRWLVHLRMHGQVLEAQDGQQALAVVETHYQTNSASPSLLILLDLNMPVMDGLEFLEHYAQLPPLCRQNTTVIVLSGGMPNATDYARVCTLAVEVKFKPLDIEGLSALLQQYLPAAFRSE